VSGRQQATHGTQLALGDFSTGECLGGILRGKNFQRICPSGSSGRN